MEEMIETYVMPKTSIIIGDFNYGAAELLYTRILSKMKSALPDAPTRPGGKKTDYVFVPESCQVIASGIVQTNTDHYLCWVKLSL